jgi:kumamolisin
MGIVTLPTSHRRPLAGAYIVGQRPAEERIEIAIVLRRRQPLGGAGHTRFAHREEFIAAHGADPADVALVEQFARRQNLAVTEKDAARRTIGLSGTVESFGRAFGVRLAHYESPQGSYRGRVGSLQVPEYLAGAIVAVLGLDNRPQAKPHFQFRRSRESPGAASGAAAGYTPAQVAELYNFPAGDGAGQCIGLVELGGGYRPGDLKTYFHRLGLAEPTVVSVDVDGAGNRPGGPDGADGEVMLDIEVAGAVAPRAKIAVYFAPNTDKGFFDAVTHAVHDAANRPAVISISWGGAECDWTAQAMEALHQAIEDAAALGVTVCVAAGDNGSSDGVGDGRNHVDFPASSPYALACGGTRLETAGNRITRESAWCDDPDQSATGGGVSDQFGLPDYQQTAGVPASANGDGRIGRGVPDVAGNADPDTGYQVRVDNQCTVIGGTSAVAPLWAALIARLNQNLGTRLGFVNPALYGLAAGGGALCDILSGGNGGYHCGPGWDACTGLGRPDGGKLLEALKGAD